MGVKERKERERKHRIESILDAAELVFKEKGMTAATMSDVAETAELAKGTVYLYFESKESLVNAITLQGIRLLHQALVMGRDEDAGGLEQVLQIGEAYFQFHKEQPFYADLLIQYHSINPNESQDPWLGECLVAAQDSLAVISAAISKGRQDGSIRKDIDPLLQSLLCWSFAAGTIQLLQSKAELLNMAFQTNAHQIREAFFDFIKTTLAAQ